MQHKQRIGKFYLAEKLMTLPNAGVVEAVKSSS
jgi:hypothetical protein